MLLEALDDFMLKILIGCAFVQIAAEISFALTIDDPDEKAEKLSHSWIDGSAILIAVAVVSGVGAWSDYQKEGEFLKKQQIEENTKVVSILSLFYVTGFLYSNNSITSVTKFYSNLNF